MHYFSEFKSFWPGKSNHLVIDAIKKLNSRNKALPKANYDFYTVYRNISDDKLKDGMRDLINFCFKVFIAVTKFGATSTDIRNKFDITFDKTSLKLSNNFPPDNCILSFDNLSF